MTIADHADIAEPSVKSAERTVELLTLLANAPTRMTFAELQAATGYPRSSLHALVRTLRRHQWLEADEGGARFGVGPHLLLAGTAYLDRDPALPHAIRTLDALRAAVSHTVHYARLDGPWVIYLVSRESTVQTRALFRVGRRLPAHLTALGQALLAQLTEAEVRAILPPQLTGPTERSIIEHDALSAELDDVRRRGYALEREQGVPGVACVARAVDYRIPATDAISCSMPAAVVDDRGDLARVTEALVEHTDALASVLRREGVR
jgi:DNA-binding IclR family transcriptional regulator